MEFGDGTLVFVTGFGHLVNTVTYPIFFTTWSSMQVWSTDLVSVASLEDLLFLLRFLSPTYNIGHKDISLC